MSHFMSRPHAPYAQHVNVDAPPSVKKRWDHRPGPDESRIMWRRSLTDNDDVLALDTVTAQQGTITTALDYFHVKAPAQGWRAGPLAFEPPHSTFGSWTRRLVRDARLRLDTLRPYEAGDVRLRGLGLPEDVGANGWAKAPFEGKCLLIPSLTLLIALAIPNPLVWCRLKHPLSLDLACLRAPEDEEILEIQRVALAGQDPYFEPTSLCILAFWMEQRRLPCLYRAIEGLGRPGWTLTLPRRTETVNLIFDGYERDDLIVVQRIRISHAAPFLPKTWREIVYVTKYGLTARSVGQSHFDRWK